MGIAVNIFAILFGGLHIAASAARFKSGDPAARGSAVMMACGGLAVAFAAAARFAGLDAAGWATALEVLAGCALICFAAWLNRKRSEAFHLSHHVIRGGIAALLVIGFSIW